MMSIKTVILLLVVLLMVGIGLYVSKSTSSCPDSHGTVILGHQVDKIVFGRHVIPDPGMKTVKQQKQIYFTIEDKQIIHNFQKYLGLKMPCDSKSFVELGGYLTHIVLYNGSEEVLWLEVNADGETLLIEDMETTELYVLFNRDFALYAFSLMEQNAEIVLNKFKGDKSGLYNDLLNAFPF